MVTKYLNNLDLHQNHYKFYNFAYFSQTIFHKEDVDNFDKALEDEELYHDNE